MNVHEARVRAQQARDEIDRALGSLRHGTEDIPQAVADLMLARLGVGVALRHLGWRREKIIAERVPELEGPYAGWAEEEGEHGGA